MATTNINVYAPKSEKTEVSVTQTQTSGAEIGSVTVDGTETKLYAPEASSVGVTRHILFYNGNWSTYKDEVISKLRELCDSISIGGVRGLNVIFESYLVVRLKSSPAFIKIPLLQSQSYAFYVTYTAEYYEDETSMNYVDFLFNEDGAYYADTSAEWKDIDSDISWFEFHYFQ